MEKDAHSLLNMSLKNKIEKSKEIIRSGIELFPLDKACVAWTGGKDSTFVMWLYYNIYCELERPLPPAMFIDEGSVFREVMEFVTSLSKRWNVEVRIIKNRDVVNGKRAIGEEIRVADLDYKNQKELKKLGFKGKSFFFRPESLVCNHLLKTVVMKKFLVENKIAAIATGIRWDEQTARAEETYFSPRTNPQHMRINPILHFTERDIWSAIQKNEIPFCSLYQKGYRSLGAKSATTRRVEIPAWEQDIENTPERAGRNQEKEQIMERLRTLGYM